MKKNKNKQLHKFIILMNAFVQLPLFFGTFVYHIMYISSLPLTYQIITIAIWLMAIAPVSIIFSAIKEHQTHSENQTDYDKQHEIISPSLPSMKTYMIRSLLAWVIYVSGLIAIILTTMGIVNIIMELTKIIFSNEVLAIIFVAFPRTLVMTIGFFSALLFNIIPEPLLDFYLLPNELIQRFGYEESENPLEWQTLKSSISALIKTCLIFSIGIGIMVLIKSVPEGLTSLGITQFWSVLLMFPIYTLIIYIVYRLIKILIKG